MKKYLFSAFTSFLLHMGMSFSSFAHYNDQPGIAKTITLADEAKEIINDIITVIGLKPNFEVKGANIPNAAAVTYNGKRYILYNTDFISKLNAAAGNKWASVSVLAHEIGHHLDGHTLANIGNQPAWNWKQMNFQVSFCEKWEPPLPNRRQQ